MLRRSIHHRFGLRATAALFNTNANTNNVNTNTSSSSSSSTGYDRDAEIKREEELRARVVKGMHVNFPKYDHTVYASYETAPGNFNSGGAGLSGSSSGASSSSSTGSTAQQQQPQMPQMPWPFNKLGQNLNNANAGGSQSQQGQQKPGMTDYFVFATGLVLIFYSIKLLTKGTGASSDGTLIPMWATTPILRAKYILFTVITNEQERDALKNEFAQVQKTMPFLSFFDWLDQRYPHWGSGRKYPQEHVINVIAQAIGPDHGSTSIARLVAGVMQKKSGGIFGLTPATNPNADRQTLIDEMVDTVQPAVSAAPVGGGGFFGAPTPAPFYPNVHPQWGMPQQPVMAAYGTGNGAPYGGMAPPPQHFNNTSALPHGMYYHQQPQQTELRGTQDISINDITGGAGAIPQHHYTTSSSPTSSSASSSADQSSSTSGSTLTSDVPSQGLQRDPLKRSH